MPRDRILEAAVLNITLPDPSPEKYANLIEHIYRAKKPVQVRGSEFMMLTTLEKPKELEDLYRGVFARFTEIDPNMPWFDIDKMDKASDEDLNSVNIPENLRPNYSTFFFQFDLKNHLFIFEARGGQERVSPNQVEKFIRTLTDLIASDFGASVNLISEQSSIEKIFLIQELKHLIITVELPNPDVNEELERKLKERLRDQNARRLTETLDALPGKSLEPDQETRDLAAVAAANGVVEGQGRSNNAPIKISTKNYPLKETETYSSDDRSEAQAFRSAADRLLKRRIADLRAQRQQRENSR